MAISLLSGEFHAVNQRIDHSLTEAIILMMGGRQLDLSEAGVWDGVLGGLVERYDQSLRQIRRTSYELNQIRYAFVLCSNQYQQEKLKTNVIRTIHFKSKFIKYFTVDKIDSSRLCEPEIGG